MGTGGSVQAVRARRQVSWLSLAVVVIASLVASACQATSTIDSSAVAVPTVAPATVPTTAPTAAPTAVATVPATSPDQPADSASDGSTDDGAGDGAEDEPDDASGGDAASGDADGTPTPLPLASADARFASIVGFSSDGRWAWDATETWWEAERPCSGEPFAGLSIVDVEASTQDRIVATASTLRLVGAVETIVTDQRDGIVLDTCGQWPNEYQRLTPVTIGDNGDVTAAGQSHEIYGQGDEQQWLQLVGIDRPGVAIVEVGIGFDDDPDSWRREVRTLDLTTGTAEVVSSGSYDSIAVVRPVARPDGRYAYQPIADPAGGLGCEGFGVAASIGIDDGSGVRPLLGPDQPTFGYVGGLHFGGDGYVAWTSGCEGYSTPWVARVQGDGRFIDVHGIDLWGLTSELDGIVEFRWFRLSGDHDLIAFGEQFDDNYENSAPIMYRFDLSADPGFVESADPAPVIDRTRPLSTTLAGTGSWFVGETTSTTPACGGTTLYASTTTGMVRALPADVELDSIVSLVASEPRTVDYGDGYTSTFRTVVVVTECPGEPRQLWFAGEPELAAYGMYFSRADLAPVDDVLGVRLVERDDGFGFDEVAEVVFADGTLDEVVLEAVPFEE